MSLSTTLTIVGGVAGYYLSGGLWSFAMYGAWIGGTAGQIISGMTTDATKTYGPQLENLHIQTSTYGTAVPEVFGVMRIAGNVVWAPDLIETTVQETATTIGYRYYAHFAVGLCRGPMETILRIWADTKLIYSVRQANDEIVAIPGLSFRFYSGTETQEPDSLIEMFEDAGSVPAHRGMAYIVFESFPLEAFGNRIPNINVEIAQASTDDNAFVEITGVDASNTVTENVGQYPSGAFLAIVGTDQIWQKIDIAASAVVTTRDNSYQGIPDASDFDIGLNDRIYTTEEFDGTQSTLAILRSDLFQFEEASWQILKPAKVRVAREMSEPFLATIDTAGTKLSVTRYRPSEPAGSEIYLYDVEYTDATLPSGTEWKDVTWVDEGTTFSLAFAVSSDDSAPGTTYLKVIQPSVTISDLTETDYNITSRIKHGVRVLYDSYTNQIAVGSDDYDGLGGSAIALFDGTTRAWIATITGESTRSPSPKAAWQRGSVGGVLWLIRAADSTIVAIDLVDRTATEYATATGFGGWSGGNLYSPETKSIVAAVDGAGEPWIKTLLGRKTPLSVSLDEVVSTLCERVGLVPIDDFDVFPLEYDVVRGYIINDRMPARDAIRPLMDAFFFDGVDSDGVIKFVKRGTGSVVDIPEQDLDAQPEGSTSGQRLVSTRAEESSLPRVVNIQYSDRDTDYNVGTQTEQRAVGNSGGILTVNLPMCLTADEAKQIAVKTLGLVWESRVRQEFAVPRKYVILDPSDVVTIVESNASHVIRIDEVKNSGGVLRITGVNEDADLYLSDANGVPLPPTGSGVGV